MNEKVKNSQKKADRILLRAEKIWRLVNIEGYSYTEAWRIACPITKAKKKNWGALAKRDCKLFEGTYGEDLKQLLDAANLGLPRVVQEIAKSLTQKKIELYQGKIVMDEKGKPILFEDNSIQQRGRELLVDIHGLKKSNIALDHTVHGEVVFLPQKMSEEEWQQQSEKENK